MFRTDLTKGDISLRVRDGLQIKYPDYILLPHLRTVREEIEMFVVVSPFKFIAISLYLVIIEVFPNFNPDNLQRTTRFMYLKTFPSIPFGYLDKAQPN